MLSGMQKKELEKEEKSKKDSRSHILLLSK